ncbi:ABC transporter permease [Dysgonomonas sp. 216]|uniref:ABC transporter permease n=1 Tax=Dysgonomonas sp. 216 TaxID=2302934 RepID=UPI0013D53412|nr:ABC transporter permease [Dysgonomonas sp. 216]NDW18256.1 ABC transporter permease [Dysgonomonas sp. 216]
MSQFLSFIRKEFYHILRDTRTMLILLGMPIVQIILFGFAISTEVKNTKVAVFDPSKDATTRHIIDRFQASEYFTVSDYLYNPDQIEKVLKEGRASIVMVFDENFSNNLLHTGKADIQLIVDATDPNQATTITNYATNILNRQYSEITEGSSGAPFTIVPQIRMLYNPQMKGAYNFVPGVMGLILMLICAMMTSIAIVREKETGSMEVLLVSPVKPIYIILAKAVPYFTLSIVNFITILLLSVFVLGVPIAGSLVLLTAVSLLFILVALLFGLLISNVVNTQVAAMLISGMGLMLPTILLSGMMFPIESMPAILQWIANITPARWYIEAVRKLMIQGVDGVFVIREFAILIFMALVLMVISLRSFKTRMQ